MCRLGDFVGHNLLEGVEALALGRDSVHEMHGGGLSGWLILCKRLGMYLFVKLAIAIAR